MVLGLEELINLLKPAANPNDALPSEALCIKFTPYPKAKTKYEASSKTVEYRTAGRNTLVHVDVDQQGAILAIEIFP
jgi:uncharacterized protein YuzE